MPAVEVDIFVSVGVPLPRPLSPFDVERVWLHVSGIVNDATRKYVAGFEMPCLRLPRPLLKGCDDMRVGERCRVDRHLPASLQNHSNDTQT